MVKIIGMEIIPQIVLNGIIAGAIYSMIALGFNLIYSTVKFFDLGYGALMTIGGFSTFYFSHFLGLNIFISVLLGILVTGVVGFFINKFIYSRLSKRKATPTVFLIASLGVLTALQAIVAIIFTSQFQSLSKAAGPSRVFEIFGAAITHVQLIILVSAIVIAVGLALLLKYTKFGKAVRAIGDDREVAEIVGIDTTKIIGRVFFLGACVAGLAGILFGLDTGIDPNMGLGLLLKGVVASIIGGVGNVFGGVVGAFALGFIENFGIWQISGEWKDAIVFCVLILFLLFRPRGIFRK